MTPTELDQPHLVDPAFEERFARVRRLYFFRDPNLWPCFSAAGFKDISAFRALHLAPHRRIGEYPDGGILLEEMKADEHVPLESSPPGARPNQLLKFAAALSKDWENPSSAENVITMPCDPAIYGAMMGALANANLVYEEYAGMASELEKLVVRQIANLAGYHPHRASGFFTQGGTFCNLYGYLAGIRKSLPEAKHHGMGHAHDYRIINSQGGHYSNITTLSLLGVDIRQRAIRIKISANNNIDLQDLERQLKACFDVGCVVPAIMLTMGTTDTFAVDPVKAVRDLRDRLCRHYGIDTPPHIHVDSAIGWTMLFFLEYDFDGNPLKINGATLAGLRRNVRLFRELRYADSFTVDFQKWGYAPYTSSLVMFADGKDLKYLENDPENFCYFEDELQGHTHLQSTIECSRGAAGVFAAYAALNFLGIEGYQTVLAHCLQNADYFRHRLDQLGFVKVIAPENAGPSVGFRLYDPAAVRDAEAEFAAEQRRQPGRNYIERLSANSAFHRQVFLERGKVGLYTNWVSFIAHTSYDETGRCFRLPGEKAVFLNPATSRREIDEFIGNILRRNPN
ncbi:MAG: aspartate aminotransferase family protein [Acidobacteria bacterium]|nr:aspartate aminotransferase family protein [Acidobacteriota bacterium]